MKCGRGSTLTVLVAIGGSLIVGCGGGGHAAVERTARRHEAQRLTALARAVNLTSNDAPHAMTVGSEGPGNGFDCRDAASPSDPQVDSPAFERGFQLDRALHPPPPEIIFSAVALTDSAAAAKREIHFYASSAGRRCTVEEEERDRRASGPLVSHRTTLTALPLKAPSPGYALTAIHTQTYRQAKPHTPTLLERRGSDLRRGFASDLIVFAVGRARVMLVDLHEPGRTPLANERRLIGLLYARARAHLPPRA